MSKIKMNKTDGLILSYKVVVEWDKEEFEKEVNAHMNNEYDYNYQLFGGVSITSTKDGSIAYAQAFVVREEFQEPNQ